MRESDAALSIRDTMPTAKSLGQRQLNGVSLIAKVTFKACKIRQTAQI